MNNKYEKALKILKENKQEHIIPIMEQLNENRKDALVEQILNIDFDELKNISKETRKSKEIANIEPVSAMKPDSLLKKDLSEYTRIGKNAIKQKKFAVAIMAGGQGSRLRI